jgi:hypothetical protein
MHYVGLALYAEGPTDYHFLRPLLLRLCMDVCTRHADSLVEFNEQLVSLDHPPASRIAPRAQRILEAAKMARGAWRIVFVHADAAGDPVKARGNLVRPALDLLLQEFAGDGIGVAVIPIRETEAWTLSDGDALRAVFMTARSDVELDVPAIGTIESLHDPKARLQQIFLATKPSLRNRRAGTSPWLEALGETVALDRLRQLAAFRALESELVLALKQLNIIHR